MLSFFLELKHFLTSYCTVGTLTLPNWNLQTTMEGVEMRETISSPPSIHTLTLPLDLFQNAFCMKINFVLKFWQVSTFLIVKKEENNSKLNLKGYS